MIDFKSLIPQGKSQADLTPRANKVIYNIGAKPNLGNPKDRGTRFPSMTSEKEEKLKQFVKDKYPELSPKERFEKAQAIVTWLEERSKKVNSMAPWLWEKATGVRGLQGNPIIGALWSAANFWMKTLGAWVKWWEYIAGLMGKVDRAMWMDTVDAEVWDKIQQAGTEAKEWLYDVTWTDPDSILTKGWELWAEIWLSVVWWPKVWSFKWAIGRGAVEWARYELWTEWEVSGKESLIWAGIEGVLYPISRVRRLSKIFPSAEKTLQNLNRIKEWQQGKFRKITGTDVWKWLNDRGIVEWPQETVETLAQRFKNSYESVDEWLEAIEGTYKNKDLTAMLDDAVDWAEGTSDSKVSRLQELQTKNNTEWLEMPEINEVKRYFERNNKFSYWRDPSGAKKTAWATNIDNRVREWQMELAEQNGFTNLKEINKETQASKLILDELVKNESGRLGNNAMGITDWIIVGSDPTGSWLGALVAKRFFGSKYFMKNYAKVVNAINNHKTITDKIVDIKSITEAQNEKQMRKAIKEILDWPQNKAIPETVSARAITPEWVNQSIPNSPQKRSYDVLEVNKQ